MANFDCVERIKYRNRRKFKKNNRNAIVNHIRNHITKPKAIFYELLQDLRGMAKTAKQASVYKCEESGQTSIDVKVFNTYLKTVDTICSICKSDVMKNVTKS